MTHALAPDPKNLSPPAKTLLVGTLPRTLGELKKRGWRSMSVREELRGNLMLKLKTKQPLLPGVLGYENSVMPQLCNAILSGHDLILLGERGQGKTRIVRLLLGLLNPYVPYLEGSEVRDNPLAPISAYGRQRIASCGDESPIAWARPAERYSEKLATPDTSSAELLGDIDPVRMAEGIRMSSELALHYGMIPRANRGLFVVNELPDLPERVQVSLFNLLEERDVQIRGHQLRLHLDLFIVATANPEDYTNRGRIITPLKDRYASLIRTHYPQTRSIENAIVRQESALKRSLPITIPPFLQDVVTEITFQARRTEKINQISGVSVRMSIDNLESVVSNAERRAILLQEAEIGPRISDLYAVIPTSQGKLEWEFDEEGNTFEESMHQLIGQAVKTVFDERVARDSLDSLLGAFEEGWWVEASDAMPVSVYLSALKTLKGLQAGLRQLNMGESPNEMVAGMEFILEGLHQHRLLERKESEKGWVYATSKNAFNPSLPAQPFT